MDQLALYEVQEMKTDNYRAIAVAINSLHYNPNLSDVEIQSYEIALAEIRDYMAQQEAENEPLTWQELLAKDGKPVWIVELPRDTSDSYWALIQIDKDIDGRAFGAQIIHVKNRADYGDKARYGKGWVAYNHPPKEA